MRYIEYQIVIGDAPPGLISQDLKKLGHSINYQIPSQKVDKESLFPEGVIHHLAKESYIWNFSLIYRERNFDIIKWKTSFAWKEEDAQDLMMEKGLFIGVSGGVFFIKIDEEIGDNFIHLADIMDTFIEKTHMEHEAPFIVYGVIEDQKKIAELKTNEEMLKNLADMKKWVAQHRGEFKLENLKEIKMNLTYLVRDFTYFILTKLKSKTNYSDLQLGEVHFLDYQDISVLKEIEAALTEQAKAGETVDQLLSDLFFKYLELPEFQEEAITKPIEIPEVSKPTPSKIKIILEEIRKGLRRQCPKCFNNDRNKIREVIDRENIIMENPNIYGFKYICGMCGHEWKTKGDWKIEDS